MGFYFCYGVTRELADSLGVSWYDHEKGKDTPCILGAEKDYMQPCELYDTEQRLESLGRIDDLDRRK